MELTSLVDFISVVEKRSFRAAAKARGKTAIAVSQGISRLEKELGFSLLKRTTRRLIPTEFGRIFYERSKRIEREVLSAKNILSKPSEDAASTPTGVLQISAPLAFGQRVVAPVLSQFLAQHSTVGITLRLGSSEASELSFTIAKEVEPGAISRKLGKYRRVVCGSPSYLAKLKRPVSPEELNRYNCIRMIGRERWRLTGPKEFDLEPQGNLLTDNLEAAILATVGGVGISLLPVATIERELLSGAIEILLQGYEDAQDAVYAVFSENLPSPAAEAFCSMLVARLNSREMPAKLLSND
jgi:DNA-binding transcriptional LysR family regulator